MTYKQKRNYKKYAKLFTWLAFITFMGFIAFFIYACNAEKPVAKTTFSALLIVCAPIITMVVLWMTGLMLTNTRRFYLGSIREWRNKNMFCITLKMITGEHDPNEIIPFYNSVHNNELKDILYGMMIHFMYTREEQKHAEAGRERVEKLLADFDPGKVKF